MMRKIYMLLLVLGFAVAVSTVLLIPRSGDALPLFARKYEMQCSQCHLAFPRLNAFGMQFRQNGYRLAGEKGKSPWESKELPLSLIGNAGVQHLRVEQGDSTRT